MKNQTIFVTGATSGIGYAVANTLADNGYTVMASARKSAGVEKLVKNGNRNIHPIFPLDLNNPVQVEQRAEEIVEMVNSGKTPPLYAVVLIAGGGHVAPIELMDVAHLKEELNIRLVSSVRLLQYFIPLLRTTLGKIIWIATPGLFPVPYVADIHTCDFAVNYLARTLNIELRPDGIKNILVRCGGIDTPVANRTEINIVKQITGFKKEIIDIYRDRLNNTEIQLKKFKKHRTPARQVAEKINKIIAANNPKNRYNVGYLSGLGKIMEMFPQSITDFIMQRRK